MAQVAPRFHTVATEGGGAGNRTDLVSIKPGETYSATLANPPGGCQKSHFPDTTTATDGFSNVEPSLVVLGYR